MEADIACIRKREVVWRTRLQPFASAVAYLWTALSFEQSLSAGLVVCAATVVLLLGATLLDCSLVHHLGLLLLLVALCYGLVAVGLRKGLRLGGLATDEAAVLPVVCGHLARLDCLLLAGVTEVVALRAQRPVWFYVAALVVVYLLSWLGHWLSLMGLVWITAIGILALPAALSRGWVAMPTPTGVREVLCRAAAAAQTAFTQFSPSSRF